MIDILNESIITLAQAAESLPRRRAGRKTSIATLYRWASRGLRGVRLETIKIGATTCTSHAALQRFFNRLTDAGADSQQPSQVECSDQAECALKSAGW